MSEHRERGLALRGRLELKLLGQVVGLWLGPLDGLADDVLVLCAYGLLFDDSLRSSD